MTSHITPNRLYNVSPSCSAVCRRSAKEARGLAHVEPPRQEETREEVHGGAQRHGRRLASAGQAGHRHDAAWPEVGGASGITRREEEEEEKDGGWVGVEDDVWPARQPRAHTDAVTCFVSCLTVVNQCTVKAWIFPTAVQNAAKKKGTQPPSSLLPPPPRPPHPPLPCLAPCQRCSAAPRWEV